MRLTGARRGTRSGRRLPFAACLAAAAVAGWTVDYFEADRHGTALAPLAAERAERPGWVLAVDSRAEAAAAGRLARRRLLHGGSVLQEWRTETVAQGTVEREFRHGRVVAERLQGPDGLLLEERRFTPAGELQQRNRWSYSDGGLRHVQSFDGAGEMIAAATYALSTAGRLRHFTHAAGGVTPPPTAAGPGRDPDVYELSLVFAAGNLIEQRLAYGGAELVRRYPAAGRPEGGPAPAEAASTAPEIATGTEVSYDAAGRVARVRVYARGADSEPELREERIHHYNSEGMLRLLEVVDARVDGAGRETWEYAYGASGRLLREEYRRRGALVRVSTFPTEEQRVDLFYRRGHAFLRQVWRGGVKLGEELLPEAAG